MLNRVKGIVSVAEQPDYRLRWTSCHAKKLLTLYHNRLLQLFRSL